VNFVRYADDFIVTADSEETAKEIVELLRRFLDEIGLELSEEKTWITHVDDGFDFLGWNFRKYKGKRLIKPSKKSIERVTHKIGDVIKNGKAWKRYFLLSSGNWVLENHIEHRGHRENSNSLYPPCPLWNLLRHNQSPPRKN